MHPAALVGLGGAVGSIARWAISEMIPLEQDGHMPWATITVNLLGAFLLGALMTLAALSEIESGTVLLVGTGLLGGFTTMSTFGFETMRLVQSGSTTIAAAYVMLNMLAPVLAWVGWEAAHAIAA
ncbi:MAG: fluoride efflux transporter CrcB [Acidimicrobiales bacterium]|nr:fluoride efflux transporter CrcB [Acidimicrobiales bacterium]|tara:strand:- start:86 stop:460 length:375 start_codon:yes stop_codon:yes gene_type:complete